MTGDCRHQKEEKELEVDQVAELFQIFKEVVKTGVFRWLGRKSKKVRMFGEKSPGEGSYFYISIGVGEK